MTAITQNLPGFVKDLGVSIIGKECYTSLVENLNISDVECIKYSMSKGLGIGIVVGGSVMKIPQLLLVIRARSARGLSLSAYVLETFAYAFTTAYNVGNHFPFSTYGENFFLTIQNVLIMLLIIAYAPRPANKTQRLTTAAFGTAASAAALYLSPPSALAALQIATLPLSLFSKIPQIRQNYRSRSTGQLSVFAVVSQIGGCLARLFTTAAETGDALLAAGFALALVLNLALGAQLWMYWGQEEMVRDEFGLGEKKTDDVKVQAYEPVWQQQESQHVMSPQRPGSPARFGTPPPGNRKWARKVD